MKITVPHTAVWTLPLTTRMPFHFGIASVTQLHHVIVQVELEVDGERAAGFAADGLVPRWFTKRADLSVEQEQRDLLAVIHNAAEAVHGLTGRSVFALWHRLYETQALWAEQTSYPALMWNFGVSLVERAIVDAFCRATGTTFTDALADNRLGIDLGQLHKQLAKAELQDLLPTPVRQLHVRHTVGLADPLTGADLDDEDRLDDGLPQTLEEAIGAYGLSRFKIKLGGKPDHDFERLRAVAELLARHGTDFAFTLDANESFHEVDQLTGLWEKLKSDGTTAGFMENLLFIEQPFPRAFALSDEVKQQLEAWSGHPPIIIDESDATLSSLPRALECGYAGTSYKSCKGLFKGIGSACLLNYLAVEEPPEQPLILSGEDLTTLGPVSMHQDLVVAANLGLTHLERNGQHYFRGLSPLPESLQQAVLESHQDLYRQHDQGFVALRIERGQIQFNSALKAPFGYNIQLDPAVFARQQSPSHAT